MKIKEYVRPYIELLKANHNIILTGAPGTGKTYLAKEIAREMNAEVGFVQFHPSYDYTDFVEGLRPTPPDENGNIGFIRKDGVFKEFCEKALQNEIDSMKSAEDLGREQDSKDALEDFLGDVDKKNFVFIIDEINRGEISKIFGELFFSIDPGYREEDGQGFVRTQYANMQTEPNLFDKYLIEHNKKIDGYGNFFIPKNVYIIGTMNDIDRKLSRAWTLPCAVVSPGKR